MSLNPLSNASSFTVTEVKAGTKKEDILKQIENNGKADIVLENEGKQYIISGEKIDTKELSKLLKGSVPEKTDLFREESGIYQADSNQDGKIEETELKWTFGKTAGASVMHGLQKFLNEAELGALGGSAKGQSLGMPLGGVGVTVGGFIGGAIGGIGGIIKGVFVAPIDATEKAAKHLGTYSTKADNDGFHGRIVTIR